MSRISPLRRFPGMRLGAGLFFVYLYVPIVILIVLSFNANRSATIWTGFTTDWYGEVLSNEAIVRTAYNSLIVAVTASIAATLFAIPAALGMSRRNFRGQSAINGTIALPLLVPEVVTAVATLMFFVLAGIPLGLGTVILAHTVFCIPFAYLPIRARLEGMDPRLAEAAADLYATPWEAFRRVTLPLMWPGVLSGLMLAFIISLDDFVITYFVAGAGATTLPVYIYGAIRIGVSPEVNATSSFMLLISIAFVSLSFIVGRSRN